MTNINMQDAKTQLCSLIKSLENKEEDVFVICRKGKKIAKLTLFNDDEKIRKTGMYNGLYKIDYDVLDEEISEDDLFGEF